ncbi:Septation initiation network scaffold protein cdc11 [Sphaceloma murrayae]|uniref:Septation initiation network scaffold protein cdc11 n=1 Tax=Sphaceloma murrayae TaxID=2082308 RepID=A0A2K1QUL2_9PEZI|nr:Septation initiation network scaffold protein cdc11 [Sphaceloma murrayae]
MAAGPQPWLADLPDEWIPQQPLHSTLSRLRESVSSVASSKQHSSGSQRPRLSQLGPNAQNARSGSIAVRDAARSGTVQSVDSVVRYDTVERQSSPKKHEATLTWKKRLVDGDLGYGDQTDLFGPSGLENIFQSPTKPTSATKTPSKLQRCEAMPSSPPPWSPALLERQGDDVGYQSPADNRSDAQATGLNQDEPSSGDEKELGTAPQCTSELSLSLAPEGNNQPTCTGRTASGQTNISEETFSPVFISKHTTQTGEVDYAPMDSKAARLIFQSSAASTHTERRLVSAAASDSRVDESVDIIENSIPQLEISLMPDSLPAGTSPITRLGSFVTTNRGGLSNCGSFNHRPLSPSDPESRCTSVIVDSVETHDFAKIEDHLDRNEPTTPPQTPKREDVSTVPDLPTPRSSKSPLKLFGAYDTFTNSKLLRRLSQLEDSGDKNDLQQKEIPPSVREVDLQEKLIDLSSTSIDKSLEQDKNLRSRLSTFGEHDLDECDFEANISFPSQGTERPFADSPDGSPEPDALPPGAMSPFMFHVDQCEEQSPEVFGIKRKLSDRSTAKSGRTYGRASEQGSMRHSYTPMNEEGKRAEASPIKAPTPKRQRTLHALDLEMDRLALQDTAYDPEDEDSIPVAVVLGQYPESSFSDDLQARPRNPTPSQQRISDIEDAANGFLMSSPKLQAIRDKIEESSLPGSLKFVTQSKAVASEVAAFTLNVTRDSEAGERKRSITTQDFLDEAMHIMSLIRARGRPTSGLGSVEEDNEDSAIQEDAMLRPIDRASSVLRVSRPPSREGSVSGWRPRYQPQQDNRVASQLRKFQEQDEIEIFDQTVHSLKLRDLVEEQEYSEYDDGSPADIRINGPITQDEDDMYDGIEEYPVESIESAGYSTGRTQGTSSSKKSDNVATLAPDAVAHLIPEEVGGMTFDRTQGKWVRVKQERTETINRRSPYPQSNITSDDDPFDNIPDLTVDEINEIQRTQSARKPQSVDFSAQRSQGHARFSSQDDTTFARPGTGNDGTHYALKSSVAPGHSMLDSSHQVETRATSWATEHGQHKSQQRQQQTLYEQSEVSEPFELEDTPFPRRPVQPSADLREFSNETATKWDEAESEVEELPARQPSQAHARRVSFQAQTFRQRRFGPDLDQSELSIVAELPDKRVMSVSFAVSRPKSHLDRQIALPDHDQSSLILSDLPDFTVADNDQLPGPTEHSLSATVARHGLEVEGDRYALAVQNLVKTLTDVKGDELYWEDMKQLSLSKQGLGTLHGLEEFCARLQKLDISNNAISHFDGAPLAIRWLDASHNSLTNLTAWDRLMNLQYLDVSHNDLTSLDGLGCLVHLREIKAAHNAIASLDGLADLEGLLKLDVSHNEISTVDLTHCHWTHLEELNLSANKMTTLSSLCTLERLKVLLLDNNQLTALNLYSEGHLSKLSHVSASKNKLQAMDLACTPALRFLDLDDNNIAVIHGLSDLKELDTLSLRRQVLAATEACSIWQTLFDTPSFARSLHLSGNTLPSNLEVTTTHNTVSHLEIASCGLLSLAKDFGLRFPNLRHVNLNFNALKDIRPLLNVQHLQSLCLVGNRIGRLRKCVETVRHLKGLQELDVRDNPVSLGFYPALGTLGQEHGMVLAARHRDEIRGSMLDMNLQKVKETRHILPMVSSAADEGHKKVMDEDTRLRRRVHEVLLASSCPDLRTLDGVELDRPAVLKRDQAWERLKELGILKPKIVD